jgi:transitional endoplasmic reticulum ATPase
MRFVLRRGEGIVARADVAMLTALGLPGGGMVSVGRTHVRVAPGEMPRPNELELPEDAFANGAVEPGAVVDVQRVVLPAASRVALHIADAEITSLPKELVSLPVKAGEQFTTSLGRATITSVDPGPAAIVMASTAILESTQPARRGPTTPSGPASTEPSVMIAGLENELELLTGWLRILTTDTSATHDPVAGVVVSGPVGSGRSELVQAAAAVLGLAVKPIDLRTVTTAERLLTSFERAIKGAPPHTVLYIDRLDPLLEREGGMRHQAAAVTRWLLDTAAQTEGVAVVLASTRSSIADDLDARDLLRRTLTIAAPNLERRKALLGAAIGDAADIDLEVLANASPGFSALDISTAVLDARATNGDGLTTESILGAIRTTPASLGTTSLGSIPSHGFDQVANLADVKQTLTESVIWQLTDPDRFVRMGIEPPRGLLLYGPPGTGKTFVIRALAHESGAAFFSVKGAELLDKWVGESERGVREVFSRAAAVAPAIIFFDEIDALAPVRGSSTNSVTDSVVAALLTELDGVSGRGDVFVIGATNRMDLIDPALLRPGRLEVHLHLDVPAPEARQAFFSMTSVPLSDDVDRADLVARTEGMSFADLDGLMRRAAIIAMRSDRHAVTVRPEHVDAALGVGD